MNPIWQQNKLLDYAKNKGIKLCAYSPLGSTGTPWGTNEVMECDVLKQIALTKGKSVPQVSVICCLFLCIIHVRLRCFNGGVLCMLCWLVDVKSFVHDRRAVRNEIAFDLHNTASLSLSLLPKIFSENNQAFFLSKPP